MRGKCFPLERGLRLHSLHTIAAGCIQSPYVAGSGARGHSWFDPGAGRHDTTPSFLRKQESRRQQTIDASPRRGKAGRLRTPGWALAAPSVIPHLMRNPVRSMTSDASLQGSKEEALRCHDWIPDQVRDDEGAAGKTKWWVPELETGS